MNRMQFMRELSHLLSDISEKVEWKNYSSKISKMLEGGIGI